MLPLHKLTIELACSSAMVYRMLLLLITMKILATLECSYTWHAFTHKSHFCNQRSHRKNIPTAGRCRRQWRQHGSTKPHQVSENVHMQDPECMCRQCPAIDAVTKRMGHTRLAAVRHHGKVSTRYQRYRSCEVGKPDPVKSPHDIRTQ